MRATRKLGLWLLPFVAVYTVGAAGETPLEGIFIKQRCRKLADGHQVTIESRHYYRPGQALVDPNSGASTVNQFESSARIEVVAIEALQK